MDQTKLHVNLPTELSKSIPTLFNKVAMALSDSASGLFSDAFANASCFEKYWRWRHRLNFKEVAALPLRLVFPKFIGATANASAFLAVTSSAR